MVSSLGTRPSQGSHLPCGRGVAAGPPAGSTQTPCGHVGSKSWRAPPTAASRPGGGQPQVGRSEKSPRLPVQTVLSTWPSPPSQGQTKTYQTFGLEGAVPPPPAPAAHRRMAPPPAAALTGTGISSGKCSGGWGWGIAPSVAAPFCSQDCSCAQELLSPAGTPLSFPKSPGIFKVIEK